ncbi:fumarylacetoacetate hydrolase family protein [Vitreimonas sp.]|uniref:fumarylacetoacetate hydrolase family protein n=1 Tax=Vitreimonas sp. TaxID=3069702 RepID=UPI002EDA8C6F
MKLAMFDDGAGPQSGVVIGEQIAPTGIAGALADLIPQWSSVEARVKQAAETAPRVPLSRVKLLAPVARPGKVFAIGLNYADHIAESKMETPQTQVWFTKAVTSINGPFDPIQIAKDSAHTDYEVELVAVIGKRGRYISRAEAPSYVFGYCVGNDVTERMWQHRTPQWSLGKSFDTHAPIGPWITTGDEVGDPHDLGLRCFVNGEKRQDSNTKHLVFDIWDQIEHLSYAMTLEPGDLIFTGTPGGVGAAMDPRKFLNAGDVVRCEIDKLGAIEATLTSA